MNGYLRPLGIMPLVLLFFCVASLQAASSVTVLGEEKLECHGIFNGQQFWMRLLPANKAYGDLRVLELLYTPPKAEALDGAILIDHPQILVDKKLNIIAWKEGRGVHQSGLGAIVYQHKQATYDVAREVNDEKGEAEQKVYNIPAKPAWDLHIAPLLLTFCKLDKSFNVPVYDFYGKSRKQLQALNLQATEAQTTCIIAGQQYKITRDKQGKLQHVIGANGSKLLEIKGWLAKKTAEKTDKVTD